MKKLLILLSLLVISLTLNSVITELEIRDELMEVVRLNSKIIILFYGSCEHCNPVKELFINLDKKLEYVKSDVKLYQIKVNDNPELQVELGIENPPAILSFYNGLYKDKIKKEEINQDSLNALYIDLLIL